VTPASVVDRIVRYLTGRRGRLRGTRGTGEQWEDVAEKELTASGYKILARNFRTRSGEIDFVAEEGGVLCFIEVKGRGGSGFGSPEEAVTREKQRRIHRAAEAYLIRRRRPRVHCRFDVVTILESGGKRRVEILRSAFEGPPRRRRR